MSTTVNVANQLAGGMADLVSAMAYLMGCAFGIKAALAFKEHNENPERVALSQPVTMMLVAAALLALPNMLVTASDVLVDGRKNAPALAAATPAPAPASAMVAPESAATAVAPDAMAVSDEKFDMGGLAKAKAPEAAAKTSAGAQAAKALAAKESKSAGAILAPAPKAVAMEKAPVAKETTRDPASADFVAMMEALGGLGLLGLGGWAMVLRSWRKDKAARDTQMEIALSKSASLGEQQGGQ